MSENIDYEKLFTEYKIIIDTYVFLDKNIENILVNKYAPFLGKGAKKIILPYKVRQELLYKSEDKSNPNYKEAKEAIELIDILYRKNSCIELIGNHFDYDLESQLRYVISQKSETAKIAIITKNSLLANGVLGFAKNRSIDGVRALNISKNGELVHWKLREKINNLNELVSVRCNKCKKFYKITKGKADKLIDSGKVLYCDKCNDLTVKCKCEGCNRPISIGKEKYKKIIEKGNSVYCNDCMNERIKYTKCFQCGNDIVMNKTKYDKLVNKNKEILCNDCWNNTYKTNNNIN